MLLDIDFHRIIDRHSAANRLAMVFHYSFCLVSFEMKTIEMQAVLQMELVLMQYVIA